MAVTYKKLFKLLIDREMKKKDLQRAATLSPASISKLARNKYVSWGGAVYELTHSLFRKAPVSAGGFEKTAPCFG